MISELLHLHFKFTVKANSYNIHMHACTLIFVSALSAGVNRPTDRPTNRPTDDRAQAPARARTREQYL